MRPLLLAALLALTTVLSGCVSFGGGYRGYPPGYDSGFWDGFGAAMASLFFFLLVLMVLVLAAIVVLAVLAIAGRGPVAQVAGALLLVIGLLWALASLSDGNLVGAFIGVVLGALGALALAPAATQERARTIVVGERGR